ncbi:MAG: hypothetical protein IKM25_05880 [Clostridia bacterium]|nr:hypothetical protein [Clostridia bacterium]
MKYYLGIDGGGTRTTAAVSDENGNVIRKATGKTINFYGVGMEASRRNLKETVDALGIDCFEAAFIGCSALDNEADEATVRALCDGIINAKKIGMNSDVYVALKSASGNCVAVCGTGSMAVGEKADGSIAVKGGWGHIIGDEGSAYSIAVSALKNCCIMCDKNERTHLLESAESYFGVTDFRKAIDVIYSAETAKDFIAGFAAKVGTLATNGCKISKNIVAEEAKAYAQTVIALIAELEECPLVSLYGGVFQHNAMFRTEFEKEIKTVYPEIKTEILDVPPEEGALKSARELK